MKIRAARDADHPAIARVAHESELLTGDLDERAFPRMLEWLYAEPPDGARLQFVAEHGERIVAHYGAVPVRYKLYDRTCIGGFASNLVIDKQHRAGMLFISLQSHLQREYREKEFAFVYGLITRANVLEPHLRTGWKRIGVVPVLAKPFRFAKLAEPLLGARALRAAARVPLAIAETGWRAAWSRGTGAIAVEQVAAFERDADAFLAAFTAGRAIGAVRDRRALNWRFASYPERGYRIFVARRGASVVGYAVTRRMPLKHLDALAIVDLAYDPRDAGAARALLRRCDAESLRAGVDVAAAIVSPGSPFARGLARFGYLRTPESFTLVVHGPNDAQPPFSERLFPDWHLTWFDHDYV